MNGGNVYMCIGENHGYTARMGCCGECMTLIGWLQMLTGRSAEFLSEYFEGFQNAEVVEYIYKNFGKRLSQRPNGQKG